MHSFAFSVTALAAFFSVAVSQWVDPDTVSIGDRRAWCASQTAQCPLICLQYPGNSAATYANTCDPTTLVYSCICSNGLAPNASEYSQTIPYYICTRYNSNCQAACGQNSQCAAACVQNHPCGAQNPTRVNVSTISTTTTSRGAAVSTAADGPVYAGFGGSSATATAAAASQGKSAASTVLNIGQMYGLGAVVAGVFAGFSLLL